MDYRNFSPGKHYVDESLQPQGPRRLKTSTPRGRRPNPYQKSPDGGFGGPVSPSNEGPWNKSWTRSNDSWKSRDSSRNSSFNSSFNSPGGPGQFKPRYHGGFRRDQDFNTSPGYKNIAAYYHPSMMENPWLGLEESNRAENVQSASFNTEFSGLSEGDKLDGGSDHETDSPDVLIESATDYSRDPTKDETSMSDVSSSQKSAC